MPPRVSIALLISFLACAAFFGELASKEYTKMFVSRKNLPLIHLVPAEAPPRLNMLKALHQSVELLRAAALCRKLFQPFAEHRIERLMPGFGQQPRLLDQSLICTEGDVLHTRPVYTIFVSAASPVLQADLVSFVSETHAVPRERLGKELKILNTD
jgi:hypothetical protein